MLSIEGSGRHLEGRGRGSSIEGMESESSIEKRGRKSSREETGSLHRGYRESERVIDRGERGVI